MSELGFVGLKDVKIYSRDTRPCVFKKWIPK